MCWEHAHSMSGLRAGMRTYRGERKSNPGDTHMRSLNGSNGTERPDEDHARSPEARASVAPALLLAAAFAVAAPAHAQGCAGGIGGGADATGNECNESAIVAGPAVHYPAPAPRHVAGTERIAATKPAVAGSAATAKSFGASNAPKLAAEGSRRSASRAVPLVTSARVPSSDGEVSTPCSGGSYGGMDMTGNQCADFPEADRNLRPVYASRR
jgi:hypothetical protein